MSKVQTFLQSFYSEQNLSFKELKEKLTEAPYFLIVKESHNWPDLFLLSISSNTDLSDPEMKEIYNQSMGIIVDKNNYQIVAHSYERILEWKELALEDNGKTLDKFMSEKVDRVEVLEEGTFIRVFKYGEKWIVSTLKCIDTTETFIPGTDKNFTTMFYEAAKDLDLSIWDSDFTYCFIIKHPENRCIINYQDHPVLIYVGRCNNKNFVQKYEKDFSALLKQKEPEVKPIPEKKLSKRECGFSWADIATGDEKNMFGNNSDDKEYEIVPEVYKSESIINTQQTEKKDTYSMKIIKQKIQSKEQNKNKIWIRSTIDYKVKSLSSLINIVENRKLNTHKGFLVYLKDGSRVSLVFKEYSDILYLRGTNPNIRIRYLELTENDRKRLNTYFPEYNLLSVEQDLKNKSQEIFKLYKAINIYKTMRFEDAGRMKKVIYYLHQYYKTTRCPITLKITNEKLKSLDSKTIAWLLNWI